MAEASKNVKATYQDFVDSREPYRSLIKANPWLAVPKRSETLAWGKGHYYDTTVARLCPDWQHVGLPQPTQAMDQLRRDFDTWGYCLIQDGLSPGRPKPSHSRGGTIRRKAVGHRLLGRGTTACLVVSE